jgi:hypothetical protein
MIQFKFSKAMGYDSIPFSGIGMKLGDLKAAIMQKKGLNTTPVAGRGPSVDLAITNAETNVGTACSEIQHFMYDELEVSTPLLLQSTPTRRR